MRLVLPWKGRLVFGVVRCPRFRPIRRLRTASRGDSRFLCFASRPCSRSRQRLSILKAFRRPWSRRDRKHCSVPSLSSASLRSVTLLRATHNLSCRVRGLPAHSLPLGGDAGRDALDEDGVGHAPGTLSELCSGDGALEFVGRHQCSPGRNAHAKHASSAPTYGKTCRCCGRSAPSSSAAATHGSGGGRSGSVTTGTRPHLCSSRQ